MRTAVADTSISSYYALGPKLGHQQRAILDYMAKHCHRDYTRAELADATGLRLSSVCGRVAETIALYMLTEGPRRPCRVTGVNAHPLRLAPAQMDLVL